MALQAVLTALRQLILDETSLPNSIEERVKLFKSRFVGLSEDEIQDLAKMPPQRLGVYTHSVFTAEGNILQGAFPLTVAALRSWWPSAWGPFSTFALARRVHSRAPWRGIHSMSLGRSLLTFIDAECSEAAARFPWLEDGARYEQATLEIRKAPNESIAPQPMSVLQEISHLTVEALLGTPVYVPSLLHSLSLKYDVIPLRRQVADGGLLSECLRREQVVVGARPNDYGVAWIEVPEPVSETLCRCRGGSAAIGVLAEAYLSQSAADTEQEAFSAFCSMLRDLVSSGSLSLVSESTPCQKSA